jgi:hypothetical protein
MTLERIPSPDPVREPKAYQDMLVGLVGDDDPAEVQAASAARVDDLLERVGERATLRPAEGEWSVLECIAHMADAELVVSGRYRWILAHETPELLGYDQDLWLNRLHVPVEAADEIVAFWRAMREANLALWARTDEAEKDRYGIHRERGPESYRLTFTLLAGHDRFHLAQADRALAAVEAASEG